MTAVAIFCGNCQGEGLTYGLPGEPDEPCNYCKGLGGFDIDTEQPVRWL